MELLERDDSPRASTRHTTCLGNEIDTQQTIRSAQMGPALAGHRVPKFFHCVDVSLRHARSRSTHAARPTIGPRSYGNGIFRAANRTLVPTQWDFGPDFYWSANVSPPRRMSGS